MNFKSWVPTVTGQLSFTVIGRTDFPSRCASLSRLYGPHTEGAIFVQERFTHDFALPFVGLPARGKDWFFRNLSKFRVDALSGWHYFYCIADELIPGGEHGLDGLKGTIYAVPCDPQSKATNTTARNRVIDAVLSESIASVAKQIRLDISGLHPIEAKFTLLRSGEFSLSVVRSPNAIDFLPLSDSDIERYAAQCFYFIRDIAHNHQHHDGTNDLVVRLHNDDEKWVNNVYYDLFRNVIQFKRLKTEFYITNASGILAYSEAFRKTFMSGKPESYHKEETLLSLETAKYELNLREQRRSNAIALTQTLLFGFLGSAIALSQLVGLDEDLLKTIQPSNTLISFARLVVEWPVPTTLAAFVLSVLLAKFMGVSSAERKSYIRDTMRVFSSWSRKAVGALFISFAFVLMAAAFWIATI